VRQLPGGPWSEYRLDGYQRTVSVFVVQDGEPKPVAIMLQGSGCTPLFTVDGDGTFHGTTIFEDLIAPRLKSLHFVLVEKQGVAPLRFAETMTHAEKVREFERAERECTGPYLAHATKDVRSDDVMAVIQAIASSQWAQQLFLVGHSEGSQAVTGVLRRDVHRLVDAAGLFSSAGPTQFYGSFLSEGGGTRDGLRSTFDTMQMLQRAEPDYMYRGHPARRWKSFALATTPLDDVRDSRVPLYVAHGGREANIHAADLFVLEALRQQPERALRYVVLDEADHGFEVPNRSGGLATVFDDFLTWAADPERATGVAVLK
jgi:hypothetical protein